MDRPIGIFDSGYGGLTVMKEIVKKLPNYDYLYLGDNARAPYGPRSFDTVYRYTLECVKWFFQQHCPLVVLACNTASAKALRTIQQNDLPFLGEEKRVLGVIRPTTETIGELTSTGHIGIMATTGTVASGSYLIEIDKFFPGIKVTQEACPIWVPLIENNEQDSEGASFFIRRHVTNLLAKDPEIDAILLACTHYPLIQQQIKDLLPSTVTVLGQGEIVSGKLADYLARHPEIESRISRTGDRAFYTTDSTEDFDRHASQFYGTPVTSTHLSI
ncbi:MAG: glutamate racemase [Chitinophagaceae bacterium]|nr:MAG: glutamate racemase [Chitinophagaceae bacterium]